VGVNTVTIRSFIALPIPKETANELGDVAAKMSYQDKSSALRWVDQENYHLTLAFLGEQEEQSLETLAEQLDYQLSQPEFLLVLSHLTPFPESRPKLLAAMARKSDELRELHQQVISAINASDTRFDKRKFIPHVTLGRYRHSRNTYAGTIPMNVSYSTFIDELVLYESVLTTTGAEYEPIYRFPLEQLSTSSANDNAQQPITEYLADEG